MLYICFNFTEFYIQFIFSRVHSVISRFLTEIAALHIFVTEKWIVLGLQKIAEASVTLAELNETLAVQRIKVVDQTRNCEQLLSSIGESTDIAMEKKTLSEEKRQEIEEQKKIIVKEEAEAKQALAEAQPGLDAARLALGELDKADITEIRFSLSLSFSNSNLLQLNFKLQINFNI